MQFLCQALGEANADGVGIIARLDAFDDVYAVVAEELAAEGDHPVENQG